MTSINLERDELDNFDAVTRREWLVTNGIGGYASGTIAGPNTRRYHGVLVASLRPPVERIVMVAKLDAVVTYRDRTYALCTNEFGDGTVAPTGYLQLQSFRLDGVIPVWTWLAGDALIEQRVWMSYGKNTTYVTYEVVRASEALNIELTPLCTYRDYHAQNRGARDYLVTSIADGLKIDAFWGAQPYRIYLQGNVDKSCTLANEWYWNFKHRVESELGLDDAEDLFRAGVFTVQLNSGDQAVVVATAEADEPLIARDSFAVEVARQANLLQTALQESVPSNRSRRKTGTHSLSISDLARPSSHVPHLHSSISQLILAADQFIVERRDASGTPLGKTVIAGYPWFSDWGRDTMIALPGLTLATRRYQEAASILRTFAKFVSQGMLPNRFPDAGEAPEYNTVDATLWYFVAIDEYLRATRDVALVRDLFPILRDIVDWHVRGTRFGIHMDAQDGLLFAGESGVQLTWMDAKVGDWVVTARIGKPVEINALWFNALSILSRFSQLLGEDAVSREYYVMAERVHRSFNKRFWSADLHYLFDVIDGPEGELAADGKRYDASLRPNQLFAISLRHSLLDAERAKAVVDTCLAELWTPVGLRSLSPRDPRYAAKYQGSPQVRDGVYHQGTVWSWLLGPFVSAHYQVYDNAVESLSYLDGVAAHMRDACVGQISEIFDGDEPHVARGCFAQAWGVAEILRVWSQLNEHEFYQAPSATKES